MNVDKLMLFFVLVCVAYAKDEPKFGGGGTNVTSVVGRDATLTCAVEDLRGYKVAWLRVDTQTILTIGVHVITKNHRVGVTRGDGLVWSLTLRDVRPSDGGLYMCQINTEPMITQTHHLQVSVPPDIMESTSGEVMVREGENVSLHCAATGTPAPSIVWRREDSARMRVGGATVNKWSGVFLNMSSVTRDMSGPYLCIATNGVPPSVSKRILLNVLCKPSAVMTQKMLGGYLGGVVKLICNIEANPTPAVHWTHLDGVRLQNGSKYQVTITSQSYKHNSELQILNVSRDDIGAYCCHAENPLGFSQDVVTVYTLVTTTISTTRMTMTTPEVTSTEPPPDIKHIEDEGVRVPNKDFNEDDTFVVVLSQHQMQNLDLAPSS